jgi:hypothetical protein
MTDIEQRLQRAGAAWRREQPATMAVRPTSRRSPRWLPAAAAVAVVGLAVAATALAGLRPDGERPPVTAGSGDGSWAPVAAGPLSARLRPTMVGWRDAVVVVGGHIDRPCPPNAACVRDLRRSQRDGALYDVPSDSWERLPDAPLPLDVTSSAVLDDVLYLWISNDGSSVVALDLVARTWSTLPPPPVVTDHLQLVAAGDRLVAAYGEVGRTDALDLAYDPRTRRWEPLPVAPLAPAYDRRMVWTGDRLVLVLSRQDEDQGPPFVDAAVLDGDAWRVLPEQEMVIGGAPEWSWTGARLVSASTYEADGGQTNGFGRAYPSGGYLDLSHGWTQLPAAPEGHVRESGQPHAPGGRWVANGEGLVLDTRDGRWIVLPPQPDAADQDASAAWAAGRLVVWGGAVGVRPAPEPAAPGARLLDTGAVWTPPQG